MLVTPLVQSGYVDRCKPLRCRAVADLAVAVEAPALGAAAGRHAHRCDAGRRRWRPRRWSVRSPGPASGACAIELSPSCPLPLLPPARTLRRPRSRTCDRRRRWSPRRRARKRADVDGRQTAGTACRRRAVRRCCRPSTSRRPPRPRSCDLLPAATDIAPPLSPLGVAATIALRTLPSPSCPNALPPQQRTPPPTVSAHVCVPPPATAAKAANPETSAARGRCVTVLSPELAIAVESPARESSAHPRARVQAAGADERCTAHAGHVDGSQPRRRHRSIADLAVGVVAPALQPFRGLSVAHVWPLPAVIAGNAACETADGDRRQSLRRRVVAELAVGVPAPALDAAAASAHV